MRWPQSFGGSWAKAIRRSAGCVGDGIGANSVLDRFGWSGAIGDADRDSQTEALDRLQKERAEAHDVAYVSVFGRLVNDPVWLKEVRAGDGAHPGSPGYERYFEAVREPLTRFLATP
jgi:hypothetical protein